jgi:hypothetical protein
MLTFENTVVQLITELSPVPTLAVDFLPTPVLDFQKTIIDRADLEKALRHRWYAKKNKYTWYANSNDERISLHQFDKQ